MNKLLSQLQYDIIDNTNMYKNDLRTFVEMFINTHPVFLINKEVKEKVISRADTIKKAIENGCNKEQFICYLNQLYSLCNDAHSLAFFDATCSKYPLNFRTINGDFYISDISIIYNDVTGKIIKKINNITISEVLERSKSMFSYENEVSRHSNLCMFLNIPEFYKSINLDISSGLYLEFVDGSSLLISSDTVARETNKVHTIKKDSHAITHHHKKNFTYELYKDNSICYFQFNLFYDKLTYTIYKSMGETTSFFDNTDLEDFNVFLDRLFLDLKANNTKTLVIDLRNNVGGNSLLGDNLLDRLNLVRNKEFSCKIRLSDLLKKTCSNLIPDNDNRYSFLIDASEFDPFKVVSSKFLDKGNGIPFNGKVIFIQGNGTCSSAMHFLATAKDNNNNITTIGLPTYQNPNCYGNVLPFTLPLTQINVCTSSCVFNRPDKNNQDSSLIPDISIPVTIQDICKGRDKCWDWICHQYNSISLEDTLQ